MTLSKIYNQINQILTMKNKIDPITIAPHKMPTRTTVHTTAIVVTHIVTETTITTAPPLHGDNGTGK